MRPAPTGGAVLLSARLTPPAPGEHQLVVAASDAVRASVGRAGREGRVSSP